MTLDELTKSCTIRDSDELSPSLGCLLGRKLTLERAKMSTVNEVNWGIVGTSGWAYSKFAPSVVSGGGKLVGAAGSSPDGSRRMAKSFGSDVFQSVEELLDDPRIEAVWIASPTNLHLQHAAMALERNKHVLLEKPIASNQADAQAILELANAHPNQITGIGFQHRFNPAHIRLREMCQNGELGAVAFLRFHFFVGSESAPMSWRSDPQRSGGWASNDLGTHLLDLVRFIIGEVELACGLLTSPRYNLAVDDTAVFLLRSGPTPAVVDVSTGVAGAESRLEVYGTQGYAIVTNSWPGGGIIHTRDGMESWEPIDTYAKQVEAFGEAVRGARWEGAGWNDGMIVTSLISEAKLEATK